ncbi:uncharacterized protein EDB93DRAFT_1075178 [Suillus bovinus]|uniref:uncharacterized protein n=1 Tax=Suillus bovinus TaxID=48563 RepID=UPI001B870335|nr:uncharacterized protein EDB93DRAFT_1075178 [Suillus bovinus]KAG2159322.1 hypothetical protein EDB93DRAFT_1075178 [Suillus bovinus]
MHPPDVLSQSITHFLTASLNILPDTVDILWSITEDIVWTMPSSAKANASDEAAFRTHGHKLGLTKCTLYPPTKVCINPDCTAWQCGLLLKKEEYQRVVLFTHGEGAHPGWMVHLRCQACNTNYQSNYSVKGQLRTYYAGLPQFIQVSDHQFVELELAMQWTDLMQIAYVTLFTSNIIVYTLYSVLATNCAHMYGIAQARGSCTNNNSDWQFESSLTTEQVWDSFTLLALLDY